MDVDEVLSGNVLLPPIQFSYESDVWSLPIQLGALNSIGKTRISSYIRLQILMMVQLGSPIILSLKWVQSVCCQKVRRETFPGILR